MRRFLFLIYILTASALMAVGIPTTSYIYDSDGDVQPMPDAFYAQSVMRSADGQEYTDLFVHDDCLYVLCSDGRIVTDQGGEVVLLERSGEPYPFLSARGLFIDDDSYYIADFEAMKVVRFDRSTLIVDLEISKPGGVYDNSVPFTPESLVVDRAGNIYVLVPDLYYGSVLFDSDGRFIGYFGANPTELTVAQRLDQSWKRLLNRTQRDAMERFIPVAYSSFDIDEEDFIYTCSFSIEDETRKIRKINPSGNGLLDDSGKVFGDIIPDDEQATGLVNQTRFVDIDIDNGIIAALDGGRGRVFIYDDDGELLSVFGGLGTQVGTFSDPVALEQIDNRIFVLDRADSSITVFQTTLFGDALLTATRLYSDGLYDEAYPYWREVARLAPDFELAALGLGKAEMQDGDMEAAFSHLRASNDKEQYSLAFEQSRLSFIRANFTPLALLVILIIVLFKFVKRHRGLEFRPGERMLLHIQAFCHPSQMLWQMKKRREYSLLFPTAVYLLYFVLAIAGYFATGFIFNENDPDDFNILLEISSTIGLVVAWTVVNWAVSTISDGKGTIKEIYSSLAYAFIPIIVADAVNLVLSHVLTLDEGVFMTWIVMASRIYAAAMLFIIDGTIHEYDAGRCLKNVFLTVIGIVFVVFLVFLAMVLFENTANIFSIIYNELVLRR